MKNEMMEIEDRHSRRSCGGNESWHQPMVNNVTIGMLDLAAKVLVGLLDLVATQK